MSSNNHTHNRDLQQDARAWSAFTGSSYTAALRQLESPLALGIFEERVSARNLIATLNDHPLIGGDRGASALDQGDGVSQRFNGESDFLELALATDTLRMFTPIAAPGVSSRAFTRTAGYLLAQHCSGLTNEQIIWAAASIGLTIAPQVPSGTDFLIGVSDREYEYLQRMVTPGETRPQGNYNRPVGLCHLQRALRQHQLGEPIDYNWVRPFRTEPIGRDSYTVGGFGAGSGDFERYEYRCPCGGGEIIEEHDNVPGFREHDVRIDCDQCRSVWRFVDGRPTRDWALEPVSAAREAADM